MLGCHDGIPVLDLGGKVVDGVSREGLLSDEQIEAMIGRILDRGGRVKNLYGPDGKKIAYYQVNATFFSALGEDEMKMRLARAIQLFMPGIPQVWYLDLFAGRNDYEAADRGGTGGHKEINRTTLKMERRRRPAAANRRAGPAPADPAAQQLHGLRRHADHPRLGGARAAHDLDQRGLRRLAEREPVRFHL